MHTVRSTTGGLALLLQGNMKRGEEADKLVALAGEKFAAALKIKPDMHDALNNWGAALVAQAQTKIGEEADKLLTLAAEKYARALKIKPDNRKSLEDWNKAVFATGN